MAGSSCDRGHFTRGITTGPEVHIVTARVLDDCGAIGGDIGEKDWRRSQGDSAAVHVVRPFRLCDK